MFKIIRNVSLLLPFPPTTGNHQHIQARSGRRFLRHDLLVWRREVAAIVQRHTDGFYSGEKLSVYVNICMPDRRKRDIDNILKILFDALQGSVLYRDDDSIVNITASKTYSAKGTSGIFVTVIEV